MPSTMYLHLLRLNISFAFLIWSLIFRVGFISAVDVSFTIEVEAGSRECFHQALKKDVQYETEYQVMDGGDLDVDFTILTHSGTEIISDIRKTGEVHKLKASEDGDYAFCFDNQFSRFTNKLVFFELVTDEDDDENEDKLFGELPDDTNYDISLDAFKDSLDKIHTDLQKSIQTQKLFSAIESRDRSISEHNFERINFWSSIQLFIMVSAAVANIFLIRSLFGSRDRANHGVKVRT